ncbi:uncharacterized protein LOC113398829 [Vanessa tameamea]|uniref:Uncharacterized protein LOC113398829 n=1 Tax=Vanessa tameamea TaxID=334116 RepID=A0A8B8IBC2_VANTA
METIENQQCVFLGIKVKPGPMERHKIENFALDNTVDRLKNEAEKKTNLPSASMELIHHGKILNDNATLSNCGVKNGEMVHVLKKKIQAPPASPPTYTDAELLQLIASLRTLGCTPNAPGWTKAMQLLNDESAMAEIIDHAPSLAEDCMTLSILHEVELLAALGANIQTMRRGAEAHPDLPNALRHLMRLVRSRSNAATSDTAPTSGFAYSLEALSEDEDVEEEETEEVENRNAITQEQLTAALQAATEATLSSASGAAVPRGLLGLLQAATPSTTGGTSSAVLNHNNITAEMISEAISEALTRSMPESSTANSPASSSFNPSIQEDFTTQLQRMHEMGLLNDALNIRALLINEGDANAAINLIINGLIEDD